MIGAYFDDAFVPPSPLAPLKAINAPLGFVGRSMHRGNHKNGHVSTGPQTWVTCLQSGSSAIRSFVVFMIHRIGGELPTGAT